MDSQLAGLTSLQKLDVSMCVGLSDLSPLVNLTALRRFDLSFKFGPYGAVALIDEVKDLSPLAQLNSLQELNLSGFQIRDLSLLANLTTLQKLDLSNCQWLSDDLYPLASLTSLQSLDLSGCPLHDFAPLERLTSLQFQSLILISCKRLSGDLAPLAGLTSLQTLHLSGCEQLSGDLSSLAGLTSLRTLHLDDCLGIRRFAPLESLLPTLEELSLFGCKLEDLPSEVCGEAACQNVLDKVRAHYEDLKSGKRSDAEIKVLFLGNGGAGKTQLCRRLRDLPFDPKIPTTHGIQLGEMTFGLDGFPEPVQLNLWDFGGQDIYHGSHSLFVHGQAIFLLLWTPELEHQMTYQEGELSLRHRPLSYCRDRRRARFR
jgi:internalin A